MNLANDRADLRQHPIQRIHLYTRVQPQPVQGGGVALQFLEQVALELIASGQRQNVKQALQRRAAVPGRRPSEAMLNLMKQKFEAQQRAGAFVERLFVANSLGHDSPRGRSHRRGVGARGAGAARRAAAQPAWVAARVR